MKSSPFPYIPAIYVQRFLKFNCFASGYISKSSSGPAVLKMQFLNVDGLQAISCVWKKKKKRNLLSLKLHSHLNKIPGFQFVSTRAFFFSPKIQKKKNIKCQW